MNIREIKKRLRTETIYKLKHQNNIERIQKSSIITKKIITNGAYKISNVVMFYAPILYEVNTVEIIDHAFGCNKKIVLPLLDREKKEIVPCEIKNLEQDTEECEYGFREPRRLLLGNCDRNSIDLVIVPGICFDSHNNRLGRGAGYYDKFLFSLAPGVTTIGLAFELQLVDSVPTDTHDIQLKQVISNV